MVLRSSFQSKIALAFSAASLVVSALALATWVVAQDADEAAGWVAHTYEVLEHLDHVRADAIQIELSTQSFRITGDPAHMVERDAAIARRADKMDRIGQLTADNAGQQQRLARLHEVIGERQAISRRTEQLRKTEGAAAAAAYVASAPIRETRDRLYSLLHDMENEERRLLGQRSAEHARARQLTAGIGTLAALLLAALLIGSWQLIRRQLRETETSRQALAESEERLAITLHSIGDAVLATDTEGHVTRMNPVAERLCGWPLREAQGRPVDQVFRIINERTREPAVNPVTGVLDTGEVQMLANHTTLIARDGKEIPIADSAAPIRDTSGRLVGVVLVFRDVSIEREAERAILLHNEQLDAQVRERTAELAASEERFRLLVDGAEDYAIIMLDTQGHVVTWNDGARRLQGYDAADIVGQSMDCFYAAEDIGVGKPANLRRRAADDGRVEDEGWRVRKDGSRFYADMILTALRGPDGELRGFAKVTRDISERRRAELLAAMKRDMLESVIRKRPLPEVLAQLVAQVEKMIPGMLGSILLLDADGLHLRYAAAPSLPDFHNQAIDGVAIVASAGSCEPVIVTDVATDPLWSSCRDLALLHGLRACWSTPIIGADASPLGMFALYCREPRAPGHEDSELIRQVTSLATLVIERLRDEERIQHLNTELARHVQQLEHTSRALRTLSAGNRTMLRAGDEQDLLDSMCRVVVEVGGYRMAWVCCADAVTSIDEALLLRPVAEAGFSGGLAALQSIWADEGLSHKGMVEAIGSGQAQLLQQLDTDPAYARWQGHLQGTVACLVCPLRFDEHGIGALAIFAAAHDAFDAGEIDLLSESADDLAFGIATLRASAQQRRTQLELHRLTHADALTGLPNETRFIEALNEAIARSEKKNKPFALLQVNIERLREINDALGFDNGDQLLCAFGARLTEAVGGSALVARLRGDEFALLQTDANANTANALARRIQDALVQSFLIAGIQLDVSAKMGLALFPGHGTTQHELLRHLDMALQQARKSGVGLAVFNPALDHAEPRHLTMAAELRRAIEGGDLLLHLQPKVEMATGRVCGAEGLVRWQHAERGLIPPGEFIGLAEHTGLIKPLSDWVIEAALRVQHGWLRQQREFPIAVNLSARNLRDEHLLDRIRRLLSTWGIDPGQLELEVTESSVMDDPEFSLRVLQQLHDEGIPLYIDDFGTGYSSLGYLLRLPVDYIKLDQSFVRGMSTSQDACRIVRSTIDLAHDIGRKVVAEGVETREQWDQLSKFGCDFAQGYFIARPMHADQFISWADAFKGPSP